MPLALHYQLDALPEGLQAQLRLADVERAPAPLEGGLFLGAVDVSLSGPPEALLTGSVGLGLDWDGEHARQKVPVEDPQLHRQLEQGQRLWDLAEQQGFGHLAESALTDHTVRFEASLNNPDPLLHQTTLHLWAVPDQDGDGLADIRVTERADSSGLGDVSARLERVQTDQPTETRGWVGGLLHAQVGRLLRMSFQQEFPALFGEVKEAVSEELAFKLRSEAAGLEADLNEQARSGRQALADFGLPVEQLDLQEGQLLARAQLESLVPTVKPFDSAQATFLPTPPRPETVASKGSSSESMTWPDRGAQMVIPGSTVRGFLKLLQEDPATSQLIQGSLDEASRSIARELKTVAIDPGQVLLDLEAPLPLGQEKLAIGGGELGNLERHQVPLAVGYELEPFQPGLWSRARLVESSRAVAPPRQDGIFLGTVRLEVGTQEDVEVAGRLELGLDLDGKATARELNQEELGSARAQRLQQRLGESRELAEKLQGHPAGGLLKDAFEGQSVAFSAQVRSGEEPLVTGDFFFWAIPDRDGDGKADLAVTHLLNTSGLSQLEVGLATLSRPGQAPEHDWELSAHLNQAVSAAFQAGIREALPEVVADLREVVASQVKGEARERTPQVEAEVNQMLGRFYRGLDDLVLPTEPLAPGEMTLELARLDVHRDDLVVHYQPEGSSSSTLRADRVEVEDGQVGIRVPGPALANILQDQSRGGLVDWSEHLEGVELAKDRHGQTLYPSLVMRDGRPTFELTVSSSALGSNPFSGFKRVGQEGITALPGALLNLVTGPVLGSEVDARVQIPLGLSAPDGQLKIDPDVEGIQLGASFGRSGDFNPLDLIPTRLLSNFIHQEALEVFGPEVLASELRERGLQADLSDLGVRWEGVEARGEEGHPPDLVLKLRLDQRAASTVGELAAR